MSRRLTAAEIALLDAQDESHPPFKGAKFALGTRLNDAMQAVADDSGADVSALEDAIDVLNAAPIVVSATTPDIDWSLGSVFTLATNGNEVVTFSNLVDGKTISVRVTAGAHTVTWPTALWPAGAAPTQTVSGVDIVSFVNIGGTIYGSSLQDFS